MADFPTLTKENLMAVGLPLGVANKIYNHYHPAVAGAPAAMEVAPRGAAAPNVVLPAAEEADM